MSALTEADLITCPNPDCRGTGEVWHNPTWRKDPQYDEPHRCPTCRGDGLVSRDEIEAADEAERERWAWRESAA